MNVSSWVRDLAPYTRNKSALEFSDDYTQMLLNDDVSTWRETLNSTDMPNYLNVIAGSLANTITFALSDDVANILIESLFAIIDLPFSVKYFIEVIYIPEVREGFYDEQYKI